MVEEGRYEDGKTGRIKKRKGSKGAILTVINYDGFYSVNQQERKGKVVGKKSTQRGLEESETGRGRGEWVNGKVRVYAGMDGTKGTRCW